jgi:hypothetical protein
MWNPIEKPYRVRAIKRASSPLLCGWRSDTQTFATEAEARIAAAQIKGAIVQIAVNPATWQQNGKWRKI